MELSGKGAIEKVAQAGSCSDGSYDCTDLSRVQSRPARLDEVLLKILGADRFVDGLWLVVLGSANAITILAKRSVYAMSSHIFPL